MKLWLLWRVYEMAKAIFIESEKVKLFYVFGIRAVNAQLAIQLLFGYYIQTYNKPPGSKNGPRGIPGHSISGIYQEGHTEKSR